MNRFNQYQNVDYVNMPIAAYQMVASAKEGEYQQQLDASRNTYDAMSAIKASYTPDAELKSDIINNIQQQVKGLENKNLKGPDALMQLNRIINNRDNIDKLAAIHGNTINYNAKVAADQKYSEEYGNDINLAQGNDQMNAYNSKGKDGFKAGMFSNYSPNKFLDIVGDAQKVLKDSKGNSYVKQWTANGWRYTGEREELTEKELLKKAMPLFNDPKYTNQIKSLEYYSLRNYGSDPVKAIQNYNKNYATALDQEISKTNELLSDYKKKIITNPKKGYEKAIEETEAAIKELAAERDNTLADKQGATFSNNMKLALAKSAISPYTYEKNKINDEVDAYQLAGYRSSLALHNTLTAMAKRNEYDKATVEMDNTQLPEPKTSSVIAGVNADGSEKVVTGVSLSASGGYDTKKMNDVLISILGNTVNGYDEKNKNIVFGTKFREELAKEINSGTATYQAVGRTGEYSIVSPTKGIIRINMDDQLKNDPGVRSLKTLNDAPKNGALIPLQLSLDGKNLSSVMVKNSDAGVVVYQPQSEFINTKKLLSNYQQAGKAWSKSPNNQQLKSVVVAQKEAIKTSLTKLLGIPATDELVNEFTSPSVGQDDVIMVKADGKVIVGPTGADYNNNKNARILQFDDQGGGAFGQGSGKSFERSVRVMSPAYISHGDLDAKQFQYASRGDGPLGAMNTRKKEKTKVSVSSGGGETEYMKQPIDDN